MWSRGRGALGGPVAAWLLAAACGDRDTVAGGPDPELRRELRWAAATAVALAGAPADSAHARFLPAAVEAPPRAAARAEARAPRSRRRAARRLEPQVAAEVPAAPASAPAPTVVASSEPQPERIARFADQEGVAGYAAGYGVALRGGAVGDDQCERDLPRRGPGVRTAVTYRPTAVRLGGPAIAPRPGVGPLYAPPF